MDPIEMLSAILDSLDTEVVFVDTGHIICYMNQAAKKHYARFGDILNKSIFDCHNEHSAQRIRDVFSQLQNGAEEVLYADNEKQRFYMRAVRNKKGQLLGYYEKYASPREVQGKE